MATGIITLPYTTSGCNQQYFSLWYNFLSRDPAVDATITNGIPVLDKSII